MKIENDSMSDENFEEFLVKSFKCFKKILNAGGRFYIWYASMKHLVFEKALNMAGLNKKQELIWNKNSFTLGRQDYQWKHEPCLYGWNDGAGHKWYGDRSQATVMDFNKPNRNTEHPTMKPIELICYLLKNSSKQYDIVFDAFGGSGTTLIACEQLNRKCRIIELDPRYCDVIIDRWEKFTGKKAEKLC